jgi:hypothetical protein
MVLLQEIILKPGCLYTRLIVVKKNVDIKFCVCRVLSFIFYWFGMMRRKLTIPERWQAVGMHNGGFSNRRVADVQQLY